MHIHIYVYPYIYIYNYISTRKKYICIHLHVIIYIQKYLSIGTNTYGMFSKDVVRLGEAMPTFGTNTP